MGYKIVKTGTFKSGIRGIPRKTFNSESVAYNFGLQKWGSGSYNVNGGWTIVRTLTKKQALKKKQILKKLNKPVKVSASKGKKGWKLESARHSLARKGIKTGRKKR